MTFRSQKLKETQRDLLICLGGLVGNWTNIWPALTVQDQQVLITNIIIVSSVISSLSLKENLNCLTSSNKLIVRKKCDPFENKITSLLFVRNFTEIKVHL